MNKIIKHTVRQKVASAKEKNKSGKGGKECVVGTFVILEREAEEVLTKKVKFEPRLEGDEGETIGVPGQGAFWAEEGKCEDSEEQPNQHI